MSDTLLRAWKRDPKRLAFMAARYKFVGRMLQGMERVLEVGAGDGLGALIVEQFVNTVVRTDLKTGWDFTRKHYPEKFEGVYALDVIEHVHEADAFLRNICRSLLPYGTCIIGAPSHESQLYATDGPEVHVNCMVESELRLLMKSHFHCVYLFGMNDETLHTGFGPMCHYRLAIGTCKR